MLQDTSIEVSLNFAAESSGSLFQYKMNLNRGACFQRKVSLNGDGGLKDSAYVSAASTECEELLRSGVGGKHFGHLSSGPEVSGSKLLQLMA